MERLEGSFDAALSLYLLDGTKALTVDVGLVNRELFFSALRTARPELVAGHYREQPYDTPQKCVLQGGSEYYLLAVMGVLFLVLWLALFATSPDSNAGLIQQMMEHGPEGWFAVWFAPVCGTAGLAALFVLCRTSVRWSREKLVLRYPLRGVREVYWRDIRRIEVRRAVKEGRPVWRGLRICTAEGTYKINLALLSHGKDAFLDHLADMTERYEILCVDEGK